MLLERGRVGCRTVWKCDNFSEFLEGFFKNKDNIFHPHIFSEGKKIWSNSAVRQ